MSKRGSFFEGIIVGALFGTLLGVLFAPQSGKQTRDKIREIKDEHDPLFTENKDRTIEKTRESIEKGFDKLSKMIESNKKTLVQINKEFNIIKEKNYGKTKIIILKKN